MSHGADINLKDNEDKTAYDLVMALGRGLDRSDAPLVANRSRNRRGRTERGANAMADFATIPDMLGSAAAMSMACLCGDRGVCFWVGDCPAFLTTGQGRKVVTVQLTIPDYDTITKSLTDWFGTYSAFDLKRKDFEMSPSDILTVTSDGAQCDEYVLNDLYRKNPVASETLQKVVDAALRHPRSDDVSIVVAQRYE